MSILVDTNVLLRRVQSDHPEHGIAVDSVARLLATREVVYFMLQNISEFWNVATRPVARNGLGLPSGVGLRAGELDRAIPNRAARFANGL